MLIFDRLLQISDWRDGAAEAGAVDGRGDVHCLGPGAGPVRQRGQSRRRAANDAGRSRTSLLRQKRIGILRAGSPAAVGTGDYFQEMPIGIVKIKATTIVMAVDAIRHATKWISPIRQSARPNAIKYFVELGLAYQKSKVPLFYVAVGLNKIQRRFSDPNHGEVTQQCARRQPKNFRQKTGGLFLVPRNDYCMVQADSHLPCYIVRESPEINRGNAGAGPGSPDFAGFAEGLYQHRNDLVRHFGML
ncbi:MAG: hypothetical protein ACREEE_02935 [Dongiaceae bacterium]